MSDKDLEIRVGADSSAVPAGLAPAEAGIDRLNDQVAGLGDGLKKVPGPANDAGKSLGGTAKQMNLAAHEARNLSFQMNDVVMGLLSGQRPMQVAMQQGGQIGQVFQASKMSVGAFAGAMAGSIASMLPMIAVVGGIGLALDFLIKKFNEGAEANKKLVKEMNALRDSMDKSNPSLFEHARAQDLAAEGSKNFEEWTRKKITSVLDYAEALKTATVNLYLMEAAEAQQKADEYREKNTRRTARGVVYKGLWGEEEYRANQGAMDATAADARARAEEAMKAPTSAFADAPKKTGGSKGQASQVAAWQEELQKKLIAEGDFFKSSTETELRFWEEKLQQTKAGSSAQAEVQSKVYQLKKTQAQADVAEEMARFNFKIELARDNMAEALQLEAEKVARVKEIYGEESKEYQDVLREQARMQRQHEQTILNMKRDALRQATEARRAELEADRDIAALQADAARRAVDESLNAGRINAVQAAKLKAQINAAERLAEAQHLERMYQLQVQALRDELDLQNLKPEERDRINREIERLTREHNARMKVIREKDKNEAANDAAQIEQENRTRIEGMVSPVTDMFAKWATGMQSLQEGWQQLGQFLLQRITEWATQMVTQWVMAQLGMTTASATGAASRTAIEASAAATSTGITGATALANIGAKAAEAAAGAYAAIAGIPFIGPFLAPAMAAAALAGVLALGSKVFSAKGGWGRVPYDGATTVLHEDEMVLPANIATPLRSALTGGGDGGGGGGGGGGRGGDSYQISALDARSLERFLKRNPSALARGIKKVGRAGYLSGDDFE